MNLTYITYITFVTFITSSRRVLDLLLHLRALTQLI
jgi:hypothetical protein